MRALTDRQPDYLGQQPSWLVVGERKTVTPFPTKTKTTASSGMFSSGNQRTAVIGDSSRQRHQTARGDVQRRSTVLQILAYGFFTQTSRPRETLGEGNRQRSKHNWFLTTDLKAVSIKPPSTSADNKYRTSQEYQAHHIKVG